MITISTTALLLVLSGSAVLCLLFLVAYVWIIGDPSLRAGSAQAAPALPASVAVAGWYRIEVQGREGGTFTGLVEHVELVGAPFLSVREPTEGGGLEPARLLAPRSIWTMTPLTETAARAAWAPPLETDLAVKLPDVASGTTVPGPATSRPSELWHGLVDDETGGTTVDLDPPPASMVRPVTGRDEETAL
jgi:hypothetical protein